MIVEACIFSPSLTRQLHYHSQLDKSRLWFWKSNEDNLLWILWMRSQFTPKVPPSTVSSALFDLFCSGKSDVICLPFSIFFFCTLVNKMRKQSGVKKLYDRHQATPQICFFWWFAGQRWVKADGPGGPGPFRRLSLPLEDDFTACHRAFHLLQSRLSHHCLFARYLRAKRADSIILLNIHCSVL